VSLSYTMHSFKTSSRRTLLSLKCSPFQTYNADRATCSDQERTVVAMLVIVL
jgi:hypothetical protein